MDTRLIEHIIKIAEEKSITKAAEKLYLTQSALNQQLLKLEHELGTELFKRNKADWSPTKAGEIYLEGGKEILRIKKQSYRRISDLTDSYKGTITVGMTPVRGPDMFIHVYPHFHKTYPNMVVVPYELSVHRMQPMIASGDLDIGFVTLFDKQKIDNEYINLYEEEILIAIPSSLDVSKSVIPRANGRPALPLSALKDEPFIFLNKGTTMRPYIDKIFREQQIVPQLLFDTANTNTILEMVRANICCGIVSESTARRYKTGIQYFSFEKPLKWNVTVSYQKGVLLSKASLLFIEYAKKYWLSLLERSRNNI